MSLNKPDHLLYNQLCKNAKEKLPSLGFRMVKNDERITVFSSRIGIVVSVVHGGYDMPDVQIGNRKNHFICRLWGPLEYFMNDKVPFFKKHQKLKSFYDFEYYYDLIENYSQQLLEIISSPKKYLEWEQKEDLKTLFEKMKET